MGDRSHEVYPLRHSGSRLAVSGSTSSDPVGFGAADELCHTHTGIADAGTVATFRRSFSEWLDRHLELGEERAADIVLATDEAMSNCADHAYRVVGRVGAMTLQISYYPATTELKVCVVDHGRWLEPDFDASSMRGRGIVLMRALADDCAIDGGSDGTSVCLRFYGCPPKSFVLSQAS
ncbi:MAG: ATP-binding protein [Mycobacterium sp.]|nr:MAG: ATP-binding protein [Mycobacterium sp.]